MSIVAWTFIGAGLLTIAVAAFWSWRLALEESRAAGMGYLWQPYAIYYVITRWPKMRRPFFLGLVGTALIGLGAVLGWSSGTLPP
jgi:hypothetical protein